MPFHLGDLWSKSISRDDEVGFGGEVCLASKENVDTVLMHEELDFVFVLV